jgi:outer membrane protein assembly factor BamB
MSATAGKRRTFAFVKSSMWAAALCLITLNALCSAATPDTVGWRMNGIGAFPTATPPTQWASAKNMIWSAPIASGSNASPVLTGIFLFTCAEPDKLLCFHAPDGTLLWEQVNSIEAASKPEDVIKIKQAAEIEKNLKSAQDVMRPLNKQFKQDPNNADLKKKLDEAKDKIEQLHKQLEPFSAFALPEAHQVNGYTSSTPATDGKNVYAVFGNGVAACYDVKGTRLWIRKLENPRNAQWGHSASPVLVGDKVFVHLNSLVALNAATGETLWTANVPSSFGTPAPVKIGDTDALLTPAGDIVRQNDGKVLASKLGFLKYASPLVQDSVAYFVDEAGGHAIKIPEKLSEPFTPEVLWNNKPSPDRYYASPVLHDGLLYAVTQKGDFSVFDAKTGTLVYEKKLDVGGTYYPSIVLAGKYLYVSVDSGTTFVIEPGREYKEIARNTLDPFRGTPVFDGKRVYVRTQKALLCIGDAP